MSVAIALSTVAAVNAAAANAAAAQAQAEALQAKCIAFQGQFQVDRASVQEKQTYAQCVQILYPQVDQNESLPIGGKLIVAMVLIFCVGGLFAGLVKGFKDEGDFGGTVIGGTLGLVIGIGISIIAVGVVYGIKAIIS